MTSKSLLILGVLILSMTNCFGQFDKTSSYQQLESIAGGYYQNNKLDSAILVMEYAFEKFPEEDENTSSFLGVLYSTTGKKSKAISIWRYGIEKGYGYGLNETSFVAYFMDNAEFAKLAAIEKSRDDTSHLAYELILPTNYDSSLFYPTLFIFHGNSSNIERAKIAWTSKTMKEKYISIFVQSYAHTNSTEYKWMSSDNKTNKEFVRIYDTIMSTYPVDRNKVIFSGMSAGGRMVIDFAFKDFVPITGLILNCPVVPNDINDASIVQFIAKDKKIGIITGEYDFALNDQKQLINSINKQGGQNILTINKDSGHEYTEEFSNLLDKYLKWMIE